MQVATRATTIRLARVDVLSLYDIHGNIDALEAVLADPRAAGADVVVVGGDTVPGPFARAALARLDSLRVPVRWVRGNGEREVAEAVRAAAAAPDDLVATTAAMTVAAHPAETASHSSRRRSSRTDRQCPDCA